MEAATVSQKGRRRKTQWTCGRFRNKNLSDKTCAKESLNTKMIFLSESNLIFKFKIFICNLQ